MYYQVHIGGGRIEIVEIQYIDSTIKSLCRTGGGIVRTQYLYCTIKFEDERAGIYFWRKTGSGRGSDDRSGTRRSKNSGEEAADGGSGWDNGNLSCERSVRGWFWV